MPKDYSPFSPGQPVPAEFFVGRKPEIKRLQGSAEAAAGGRLQVAFLDGERGIGKSSLASIVRSIAERDLRVLGIHSFLGGVSSLEEMARRVFDRLLKESVGQVWHEQVKTFFGDHIKRVGLFGLSLEFSAPRQDLTRVVHDFATALRNLLAALRNQRSGLLLVLDDINGLAGSMAFANWLKSLVDEIATARDPLPLFILLVGLPERRHSLVALQPSLARVFDLVEIQPWSDPETRDFFLNAFSKVRVRVDQDALDVLVRYAGGLPVPRSATPSTRPTRTGGLTCRTPGTASSPRPISSVGNTSSPASSRLFAANATWPSGGRSGTPRFPSLRCRDPSTSSSSDPSCSHGYGTTSGASSTASFDACGC